MDMIFTGKDISSRLDEELATLAQVESQFICEPADFRDAVGAYIETGGGQSGERMPWSKLDGVQRLRKGELSVWAGINGHGKSQLLGQVMLWRMANQKVLIASLEMKPHQTLVRMIAQYAGCNPSKSFAFEVLDKFKNRLWIYDQLDTVQSNRILALVHYAAKDLGVDHIVIDSLMKCGFGSEDYDAEKKFIDRLQWAAKTLGVHIHVVMHARKGKSENDMLDKFDVKGGSAMTDIPDNVFIIQRNKRREEVNKKIVGGYTGSLTAGEQDVLSQPDVWLRIAKNRHGAGEGLFGLYYHKESGQYLPKETTTAMPNPF